MKCSFHSFCLIVMPCQFMSCTICMWLAWSERDATTVANLSKRQKPSDVSEDFIPESGFTMAALYFTSGAYCGGSWRHKNKLTRQEQDLLQLRLFSHGPGKKSLNMFCHLEEGVKYQSHFRHAKPNQAEKPEMRGPPKKRHICKNVNM